MEEASSSDTLVTVCQTTRCPIPEKKNLDQHCCQNLNMHNDFVASFTITALFNFHLSYPFCDTHCHIRIGVLRQ
jgi:hypothetical protein